MRKLTIQLVTALVALALAGSALAGSLTSGYGGMAGTVQSQVKAAVAKTAKPSGVKGQTTGTLPFTGLDLSLIVAGGVVLLLAGMGLRRAGRNRA